MSKRNPNTRRHEKIYQIQDQHRRQELEWRYSEEAEAHLEKVRNVLISMWLGVCFVFAYFLREEQAVIVWAGGAAVLMVVAYQARSIWLSREMDKRREDT